MYCTIPYLYKQSQHNYSVQTSALTQQSTRTRTMSMSMSIQPNGPLSRR